MRGPGASFLVYAFQDFQVVIQLTSKLGVDATGAITGAE
jgi:hypothetical protein